MKNPFTKYITGENKYHIEVCKYINFAYPHILWFHCPNESKRTPFERYLISQMGVKSGVPDLLIFEKSNDNKYYGLAIELKVGKNKTTDNQNHWLKELGKRGWKTAVCYDTIFPVQEILSEYFGKSIQVNFTMFDALQKIQNCLTAKEIDEIIFDNKHFSEYYTKTTKENKNLLDIEIEKKRKKVK